MTLSYYNSPFFRWSLFVVLEGEVEGLEGAPELFGHLGLLLLADLAVAPVYPILHVQQRLAGQRLASELSEVVGRYYILQELQSRTGGPTAGLG